MGFTHHEGVAVSNLIASAGTIGSLSGTTFKATTKVSSATINATTNFNLKSIFAKNTKSIASCAVLSDGSGFLPAVGDTILRAFQWKFSSGGVKSASTITATTKIKGTGVISFAAPVPLSGAVILIDFLDKT